jgi:CheY-like chemotaxis protein
MRTIMILDDERVLREAFAAYFEDCQWKSIQAESAEEALSILEDEPPSAVLVDIRLPGMDGDEFIRRACQQNSKTAFVICTGSPEYIIPPDLRNHPQIAERPFRKPVTNLMELQRVIIQTIEQTKKVDLGNG